MEADGQKLQLSCAEGGDASSQDDVPAQPEAVSNGEDSESEKEHVEFKIIWNKKKYDVRLPLDSTGASLKQKIHTLTGVASFICCHQDCYTGIYSFRKKSY